MELRDKSLDPEESLRLIQLFISRTRYNVRKSAFGFIFWGILIALAALLQYFLIRFTTFSMPWLPWPVFMIGGFLFSVFRYSFHGRERGAVSAHGFFFKWLFFCGGLTYFLLVFLCDAQHVSPIPFMLALTSLLISVSGLVLRYRPLLWGGILFSLAAIACIFISPLNQLLLMAVGILAGYLLPGILLTREEHE